MLLMQHPKKKSYRNPAKDTNPPIGKINIPIIISNQWLELTNEGNSIKNGSINKTNPIPPDKRAKVVYFFLKNINFK